MSETIKKNMEIYLYHAIYKAYITCIIIVRLRLHFPDPVLTFHLTKSVHTHMRLRFLKSILFNVGLFLFVKCFTIVTDEVYKRHYEGLCK